MAFFMQTLATYSRSKGNTLRVSARHVGALQSKTTTSSANGEGTADEMEAPKPPGWGRPTTPPEIILTSPLEASSSLETQSTGSASPTPSSPGSTAVDGGSGASSVKGETGLFSQAMQEDLDAMKAAVFVEIEKLIGLSKVKEQFRDIEKRIEAYKNQGVKVERERFHIKFLGNPGTGKLYTMLVVKANNVSCTDVPCRQDHCCSTVCKISLRHGNH